MPGLARYQAELASAVRDASHNLAGSMLDGMSAPGIRMTAQVRRSWCIGRARRAAPLTLAALPEERRTSLLSAWVDAGGGANSLFDREAEGLLAFLAERLEAPSHPLTLCQFERAVIRARGASWDGQASPPPGRATMLHRAPDARLITLSAPVDALLAAIEGSQPWPDLDGEPRLLLIAPGIEGLARVPDARELALWDAAEPGVPAARDMQTARRLVACGALRPT